MAHTFVQDKKVESIKNQLRTLIKRIQKNPTRKTVSAYNIYVMGVKNYYKYATHVNIDFVKIAHQIFQNLIQSSKISR